MSFCPEFYFRFYFFGVRVKFGLRRFFSSSMHSGQSNEILDSTAVSIFVVVLVELTNTVFVNISTK